jgi:hypothetical protein
MASLPDLRTVSALVAAVVLAILPELPGDG